MCCTLKITTKILRAELFLNLVKPATQTDHEAVIVFQHDGLKVTKVVHRPCILNLSNNVAVSIFWE